MEAVRIRDPGWKKVGSGIRDKHPGSATLLLTGQLVIALTWWLKWVGLVRVDTAAGPSPREGGGNMASRCSLCSLSRPITSREPWDPYSLRPPTQLS
jgi:hypothetical protein